jgi:hypothetical protein
MKALTFLSAALLAGCASTTRFNPNCQIDLKGGYLLTVTQEREVTHLLLHVTDSPENLVALNPVGARLFEGTLAGGTVQVRSAPHYRGPDPATLIWGLALWQSRERAGTCWPAPGSELQQMPDGGLRLQRGKRPLVSWNPTVTARLDLPVAAMTLNIKVAE